MTRRAVVVPEDTVGAFVGPPQLLAQGAVEGPLAGVTLGVKDLVDVERSVTGAGNPTFAGERDPASETAPAIERMLVAGASVVGKTITDELAFSLSGTNVHYGTPVNVAAPGRASGGSSAGSAAAAAAGLVDLGVGTDTGGSIRVPASYCGIIGWRPTHGAVPMEGVVPLAPSFDTVGLLGREAALVRRAAAVVLREPATDVPAPSPVARLSLVAEAMASVAPAIATSVRDGARRVAADLGVALDESPLGVDLDEALDAFRALQGREAWEAHGAWLTATQPAMGEGIRGRFEAASKVTDDEVAAGLVTRGAVRALVEAATDASAVLVLPSAASAAPTPRLHPAAYADVRGRTLRLTSIAGLSGAPAVSLPLADDEGLPLGVCLVGAPGADLALLDGAVAVMEATDT